MLRKSRIDRNSIQFLVTKEKMLKFKRWQEKMKINERALRNHNEFKWKNKSRQLEFKKSVFEEEFENNNC